MAEVKKYKGSVCQEEDKTRPLVKWHTSFVVYAWICQDSPGVLL